MAKLAKIGSALRRIARDEDGNTLIMMAAAIIPMMGMIGGGLDIARAHFAKSRLSQACDAAALAGRRAMSNENIETAKPEAMKFFNFNFPQGFMGTQPFTPVITHPDTGMVKVTASTTVPTTIMRMFDFTEIPINVDCDATQNFDNIDIVLVLDVTGSMDSTLSGEKKIVSLRKAVMALYDELASAQTELAAQGLRLRYGIVPYSTTVNVGRLITAVNANYMANKWDYQSRTPKSPSGYTYGQKNVDVGSYVSGSSVNVSSIIGGSSKSVTWNGCIEERSTTSSITASGGYSTGDIPSAAKDLAIDDKPSSDVKTRWGPQFADIVFKPSGSSSASATCPAEARRLGTMTRSALQTYVDTLTPTGATYHDIGMIWGARLISRGGIFGSDNPTEYNDRPVNRYVIFMTDGIAEPDSESVAAYGYERLDRRIVGGTYNASVPDGNGSDLEKRHTRRWLMACSAAKQGGASIWAIGFGSSVPPSLSSCASSNDQVAISKNSADLIAKFKEIGKNIGALRLSK